MAYNVLLLSGGRTGFLGLWFLTTLLLIRSLGPQDFGLYSLCVAAIKIVTSVWGDALDLAVARQVPLYLTTDRPRAFSLIRTAFWSRCVLGLLLVAMAFFFASPIAHSFLHSSSHGTLILLIALGILGDFLFRALFGYFQAAEIFGRLLMLDGILQVGRSTAIMLLLGGHALTLQNALLVYIGFSYLSFGFGLCLLPKDWSWLPFPHRADLIVLYQYCKWMIPAFTVAALQERTDLFLLGHFRSAEEVGIYAAALTLATIPDFIVGTIAPVLHPRIVHLRAEGKLAAFTRQYLRWAIPIVVFAATAVFFLSDLIIREFFSDRYIATIPAFQILVLGTLCSGALIPIPSALLSFFSPRRVMYLSTAAIALLFTLGVFIVPTFGVLGTAMLVTSVKVGVSFSIFLLGQSLMNSSQSSDQKTVLAAHLTAPHDEDFALNPQSIRGSQR